MKRLLNFVFLLFSMNSTAIGVNYFVSNSGSNSNNGLSLLTAFKTITYASTVASHGDTINVVAGTYQNTSYGTWDIWKVEQTIRINNKNSTSGNYLIIRPYQTNAVKIKGDGDYIVQIRNSSYIHFEGFEIEGEVNNIPIDSALKYQFVYRQCLNSNCTSFKDTFRVAFGTPDSIIDTMTFVPLTNILNPTTINNIGLLVQNSHHINIYSNNIHHNTGTGLRVFQSDYINVRFNNIHNNSRRSSVGNHGLVFHSSTSVDNVTSHKIFIENNHVHFNYNEVYSWSPLKTFITPHIDEGKGISMQKNTVANGWTSGKILIQNNITHHNGFSGIHINEGIRMEIINNTVYNNQFSFDGSGNNIGISVQEGDSIGIYNNISVANSLGNAISAGATTNLSVSNNLVLGVIDSDIDAVDVKTIFADPLFVDTILFYLQSGSPAIDSSLNSPAPLIDYYLNSRIGVADIGSVEYVSTLPIKLLNFNAKEIENKKVEIQWETLLEIENDFFNLEKSAEGENWETLAVVNGNGTSSELNSYSTIDECPFLITYYRLKQTDFNTNFSYSEIITVTLRNQVSEIRVFPNPASTKIFLTKPLNESAKFMSINGVDYSFVLDNKIGLKEFDVSTLSAGVYLFKLDELTYKIFKQ